MDFFVSAGRSVSARGDDVEGAHGADVLSSVLSEFHSYSTGWHRGYDMNLFVRGAAGFIFIFC